MGVKLVSASGGSVEINPPATASNFVATMPAGTGTVSVNGVSSNIVSGTSQASTSGTSIDFTGIPSWVKRITVMFNGVSTNGTSIVQLQIGSGSVSTSSYSSTASYASGAGTFANASSGFIVDTSISAAAANTRNGAVVLTLVNSNTWVASGTVSAPNTQVSVAIGGVSPNLSGTLDRVRITTINGTDTFDAGTINILYE